MRTYLRNVVGLVRVVHFVIDEHHVDAAQAIIIGDDILPPSMMMASDLDLVVQPKVIIKAGALLQLGENLAPVFACNLGIGGTLSRFCSIVVSMIAAAVQLATLALRRLGPILLARSSSDVSSHTWDGLAR
jgi:hypothetical protein